MTALVYVLAALGVVPVVGLLALLVWWAAGLVTEWGEMLMRRRACFHEGRVDALANLRQNAAWFSEDPATMCLIQDLAEGADTYVARERWRAARKEGQP